MGFIETETAPTPRAKEIRVVKSRDILPNRRDQLLKTIDHLESQAGRLAQMARDIRAEVLSLTVGKI